MMSSEWSRSRVGLQPGAAVAALSPHLYWRFLVRFSRSACPEEYCSITSFTSYGFNASLNLLRATKYLSYTEIKQILIANIARTLLWQIENILLLTLQRLEVYIIVDMLICILFYLQLWNLYNELATSLCRCLVVKKGHMPLN